MLCPSPKAKTQTKGELVGAVTHAATPSWLGSVLHYSSQKKMFSCPHGIHGLVKHAIVDERIRVLAHWPLHRQPHHCC